MINLDDFDMEQLVSYEGFEYKLSSGNSGLQINVKDCPHCGGSNWKVYLNAESGLGNCFRCDFKFNKYKFIKEARQIPNHSGVMKYFESISSFTKYKTRREIVYSKYNKDWKLPLNTKISSPELIPDYLKDRNIDLKICERFDLRYCDAGFYVYEDFFGKNRAIDFSKRVIIPVRDIAGNLITFQGRDITGKSDKKYLFPNRLAATGSCIYNAHYIIQNKIKKAVLCEGVFDVFATVQALESDVRFMDYGVAGTFGKHLSVNLPNSKSSDQLEDLIQMRNHGLEQVVILWDGEKEAVIAANKTALLLQNYGFDVRVGILPENKDPAEVDKATVLKSIVESQRVSKLSSIRYKLNI